MKTFIKFFSFALIISISAKAQNNQLFEFIEFQDAVKNETRTRTGDPGAKYWQNSANYKLKVSIDTTTNLLKGSGTIIYHNNSPYTLKNPCFRLYQDKNKPEALHSRPINKSVINSGVFIDSLSVNGIQYIRANESATKSILTKFHTTLYFDMLDSIQSGESCKIDVAWNFTIPPYIDERMGKIRDDYFVALWYPQLAVFDDINEWDTNPHSGIQEFYNDFNNYDVTITAPEGYMIWGTGECTNLSDILEKPILEKFTLAKSSDENISIIDSATYKTAFLKSNIWHFTANDVTDFAFAVAKDFLWEGSSIVTDKQTGRRALINVVYPKEVKNHPRTLQVAKDVFSWTSHTFPGVPYPYPHATAFLNSLGKGGSMEFPMICNNKMYIDSTNHYAVLVHELLHNYMPFYLGCNETLYGWMDEGWTDFLENKFSGNGRSLLKKNFPYYTSYAGTILDKPAIGSSMDQTILNSWFLNYAKPSFNLMLLEDILGSKAFKEATADFMNTWKGKHPTPYDFFNIFKRHAPEDINWLLKACYFEYGYPDLGISTVNKNQIHIVKKGNIPVPINLEVTYKDNSVERIYQSLRIWKDGNTKYTIKVKGGKEIKKIVLGNSLTPDTDQSDNIYQK